MTITHTELGQIVLEWLKEHPEAADMTFNDFLAAINKVVPCDRAELSVTVTLMNMTGIVKIEKDHHGRGTGFMLAENIEA